jgi:hypothetical protein
MRLRPVGLVGGPFLLADPRQDVERNCYLIVRSAGKPPGGSACLARGDDRVIELWHHPGWLTVCDSSIAIGRQMKGCRCRFVNGNVVRVQGTPLRPKGQHAMRANLADRGHDVPDQRCSISIS